MGIKVNEIIVDEAEKKVRLDSGLYKIKVKKCKKLIFISEKLSCTAIVEFDKKSTLVDELIVSGINLQVRSDIKAKKIFLDSATIGMIDSEMLGLQELTMKCGTINYSGKEHMLSSQSMKLMSSTIKIRNASFYAQNLKIANGSRIFVMPDYSTKVSVKVDEFERDHSSFLVLPDDKKLVNFMRRSVYA